jgi:stage II sporulation protein M
MIGFTLVRMGVKIFNREELLGRDIDQLRLGWISRTIWNRFAGRDAGGRYPGLGQWYRQLFALLPELRWPAAALLIAFVGAAAFGLLLARLYRLPTEAQAALAGTDLAANLSQLQLLLDRLPLYILFHNVRVIALAAVVGIFSFGVLGVLIFMLPWGLIAYLAAQLSMGGANAATFILAAIAPHAVLELPALLLAGAAALRWHATLIAPPRTTVSESWLLAAADFGRVMIGLALPLLFLAALVEAFVTPQIMLRVYGG